MVDCRPAEQYNAGHLSTAFHLDSDLVSIMFGWLICLCFFLGKRGMQGLSGLRILGLWFFSLYYLASEVSFLVTCNEYILIDKVIVKHSLNLIIMSARQKLPCI